MSEALYSSLVLEHSRVPQHAGRPPVFDAQGHGENRICGDDVTVFFTRDTAFWRHEARGCAILTASADLMCARLNGMDLENISLLGDEFEHMVKTGETQANLGDLNALASLAQYPARFRCATLPWSAARRAIANVTSGGIAHG